VAGEITLCVLVDRELPVLAFRDDDAALEVSDQLVVRLDAAVEDADADALSRRAPPGPVARDALGRSAREPTPAGSTPAAPR
jgi:hypothetical protein